MMNLILLLFPLIVDGIRDCEFDEVELPLHFIGSKDCSYDMQIVSYVAGFLVKKIAGDCETRHN